MTLIIVGPNVTTTCAGATKTVTVIAPTSTRTITSTVIRTSTADTEKTSFYTTTITATASCHYSSPGGFTTIPDNDPFPTTAPPTWCIGSCWPTWTRGPGGGGWGWGPGQKPPSAANTGVAAVADRTDKSDRKDTALRRRVGDHEQRAANKVAAVTSTVTETTYTVTKTVVTTIPARTTTETGKTRFHVVKWALQTDTKSSRCNKDPDYVSMLFLFPLPFHILIPAPCLT